jgi:hypothetical protein
VSLSVAAGESVSSYWCVSKNSHFFSFMMLLQNFSLRGFFIAPVAECNPIG